MVGARRNATARRRTASDARIETASCRYRKSVQRTRWTSERWRHSRPETASIRRERRPPRPRPRKAPEQEQSDRRVCQDEWPVPKRAIRADDHVAETVTEPAGNLRRGVRAKVG